MSGSQIRAYRPLGQNKTVNATAAVTNAVVTIPDTPFGTRAVRLANIGTQTIFIELGTAASVATTTTSTPILANTVETFTLSNDVTSIALISGTIGSVLYITYGEGL